MRTMLTVSVRSAHLKSYYPLELLYNVIVLPSSEFRDLGINLDSIFTSDSLLPELDDHFVVPLEFLVVAQQDSHLHRQH